MKLRPFESMTWWTWLTLALLISFTGYVYVQRAYPSLPRLDLSDYITVLYFYMIMTYLDYSKRELIETERVDALEEEVRHLRARLAIVAKENTQTAIQKDLIQ